MTSRILNRFNIKTDRLLRSIATDKLSCDIHPRKMIKMVRHVSRDHIIMHNNILFLSHICVYMCVCWCDSNKQGDIKAVYLFYSQTYYIHRDIIHDYKLVKKERNN